MAKGQSTFQQLGRIDGRKYYRVKGVDGIVSQHINEKIGEHVKNDAAYANTRLNNAEFGGAGSTAGAITRVLSQKWRYLLVPFATGKLAKDVRSIMMLDATGKWGQRGLVGSDWQKLVAERVSQFAKTPINDYLDLNVTASFNASTGMKILASAASLSSETAIAKGADGAMVITAAFKVDASAYDASADKYSPASSEIVALDLDSVDFGDECNSTATALNIKVTAQADNTMYGGLCVVLPYKTINGTQHIMQELCTFKMVAAE